MHCRQVSRFRLLRSSKDFRMGLPARIGLLQPYCSKCALLPGNSDCMNYKVDIIPLLPVNRDERPGTHLLVEAGTPRCTRECSNTFEKEFLIQRIASKRSRWGIGRWVLCRQFEFDRARGAFPFGECIAIHFVHDGSFTVHIPLCPNPNHFNVLE